uniref:Uncharacterized protein n=1 Tax=Rhizophora mucronata TaxID=61149 RepID=A0A2P2R3X0_RHIMU
MFVFIIHLFIHLLLVENNQFHILPKSSSYYIKRLPFCSICFLSSFSWKLFCCRFYL